jgi:hypothetical protein
MPALTLRRTTHAVHPWRIGLLHAVPGGDDAGGDVRASAGGGAGDHASAGAGVGDERHRRVPVLFVCGVSA